MGLSVHQHAASRVPSEEVVGDGDGVGPFLKGRAKDLTRVSNAFVQTATGNLSIAKQSVTGVEQEDPERFTREALHLRTEQVKDRPGPVDARTFLLGAGHATAHLKGRLEFRRLGRSDSGGSREFPGGAPCEPAEGSPLAQQGLGNGHDVAASHPCP